ELLKYYQSEIYGRIPATAPKVTWQVVSNDSSALGGIAVMKQLAGHMGSPDGPAIGVTLYTPAKATKPVPILVSISFNFGAGRGRGTATTNALSTNAPGAYAYRLGTNSANATVVAVAPAAGAATNAASGAAAGRGFGGPQRGTPTE